LCQDYDGSLAYAVRVKMIILSKKKGMRADERRSGAE